MMRPADPLPKVFGLPTNLPAELIGRRPDIVAARWRAEASASRIKRDRAAFYPNVNLAGLIGAAALPVHDLTSNGSEVGSVGPALTLPIFDGGLLRANLKASEAARDEAIATYDETGRAAQTACRRRPEGARLHARYRAGARSRRRLFDLKTGPFHLFINTCSSTRDSPGPQPLQLMSLPPPTSGPPTPQPAPDQPCRSGRDRCGAVRCL
jgi:hypothetical protein